MYYERRKEDENMFLMARKGDWFISLYQCKKCWFVNVCGRLPRKLSVGDRQTIDLLRRDNLDIFWSQDTATVKGILGYTEETKRRAREGGRLVPFTEINPWTFGYNMGMGVAIKMLEKLLDKGRDGINYLQFNTVRQLQAAFSDVYSEIYGSREQVLVEVTLGQCYTYARESYAVGIDVKVC